MIVAQTINNSRRNANKSLPIFLIIKSVFFETFFVVVISFVLSLLDAIILVM